MKLASIVVRRVPHTRVLTRSITTNAPTFTRSEDPMARYKEQSILKRHINLREKEFLKYPRRVEATYAWDTREYYPVELNGKETNIMLDRNYDKYPVGEIFRPEIPIDTENVKKAEEKIGGKLPEDYRLFLGQLETSNGIRAPAHIWDKNKHLLEGEEGDVIERFFFASELEIIGSLLERWDANLGSQKPHKWQKYPAVQIATYGNFGLLIFINDHKSYKKGEIYMYRRGEFDELKPVADSFTDLANSFFTTDEEEEYAEFRSKIGRRVDERRRYKRLYNPKNFEYEGSPGPSPTHRYYINKAAKEIENNKDTTTKRKVAEKYEWDKMEWKYMRIGDRYTRLCIFEEQRSGNSEADFRELEERDFNYRVPEDYREFLKEYDGAIVKPPSHVWRTDGFVAFDEPISQFCGSLSSVRLRRISTLAERKGCDKNITKYKDAPAIGIAGDTYPTVFMSLDDHIIDGKTFKRGNVWTFLRNNEVDKDKTDNVFLIASSFTEYCNNFLTDAEEEAYENMKEKINKKK